ncbi:hypothetical protein FB567DRAFT_594962 [Paraphoma chrysanthemicola]|uniref:LysM domain-containing protein n=1 Tax=Paraphoma chrysanthemicola TaxID=798071 RepID=A0A8K0R1C3_9PLEO|nr:hypothetical protein FB567DRAFT_594962 [Paraphoma chrysanthemicola]
MGRWTDMDDDERRLPDGMQRIGYDSDTERYTFRDTDGSLYESAPGSRYGNLQPVGHRYTPQEVEERNERIRTGYWSSVRMFMPFALAVLVFLLVMFKLVDGGFGMTWAPRREVLNCANGTSQIQVQTGDSCWRLGQEYGVSVDELKRIAGNEKIECDKLRMLQGICVPDGTGEE